MGWARKLGELLRNLRAMDLFKVLLHENQFPCGHNIAAGLKNRLGRDDALDVWGVPDRLVHDNGVLFSGSPFSFMTTMWLSVMIALVWSFDAVSNSSLDGAYGPDASGRSPGSTEEAPRWRPPAVGTDPWFIGIRGTRSGRCRRRRHCRWHHKRT